MLKWKFAFPNKEVRSCVLFTSRYKLKHLVLCWPQRNKDIISKQICRALLLQHENDRENALRLEFIAWFTVSVGTRWHSTHYVILRVSSKVQVVRFSGTASSLFKLGKKGTAPNKDNQQASIAYGKFLGII